MTSETDQQLIEKESSAESAEIVPPRKIKVAPVPGKGRGVMAQAPIAEGETVEVCPLVVLGEADAEHIASGGGVLAFYALELTAIGRQVLMLGYGSLYNHSRDPNAEVEYAPGAAFLRIRALRDIPAGEEVVFDYEFEGEEEFLPSGEATLH